MSEDHQRLLAKYEPKEIAVITAQPQVASAHFSPCGRYLCAGGYDRRVRRWDMTTDRPRELASLGGHDGWVEAIAFHGETLYSADTWGKLAAWKYTAAAPSPVWTVAQAHEGWIRQLAVSSDGQYLASCGRDQKIQIFRADNGEPVRQWFVGQDLFCVLFHPHTGQLVSGDLHGQVNIWELGSEDPVRTVDASVLFLQHRLQDVGGVRALAFDQAGKILTIGGTKPKNGGTVQGTPTLLVVDFESGELRNTLEIGGPADCFVHMVRHHDAGFLMAVTSGTPGNGRIVFQRPADAEPFYLNKNIPNCHSLSLHPDGNQIAVAATNRGSNGNGRPLNANGDYIGNYSPIHLLAFSDVVQSEQASRATVSKSSTS